MTATARADDELRDWAASAVAIGRAAWPGVEVSEHELADAAARRSAQARRVDALDAAELYLAAACARGDRAALDLFRARFFDVLSAKLRGMGLDDAQRDDVWQTLCTRLFVGAPGEAPRIVRYAGAGQLAGLVRVAATRLALHGRARSQRDTPDDRLDELPATGSDPELHFMKREHRAALKQELEAAVHDLDARQRMMLRLHLVERLGIDAIATICAVHRATAARQVAAAKELLATRVRLRLVARWQVADPDLPALRTLVDSQLDLSLRRLLAA